MALPWAAPRPATALDPSRAASQYVVTKWGTRDLSSNTVHTLLQTRDRYLWVGTSTGVLRFDGARFVAFSNPRTPDFGDGGVTCLNEGPDGSLYLGTTSGAVVQYKNGAFAELPVRAGTGFVSSLLSARDGSLWIARHGRTVYRWKDGAFKIFYTTGQGPAVLAQDAAGDVWVGTRGMGLLRFDGGDALEDVFRHHGVTPDEIRALLFDRSGALWLGTSKGLLRWERGHVQRFTTRDGLSSHVISALLEDRDGNLWIGTSDGGLNRRTAGHISRLNAAFGLSDDDVRSLLEDHEGNLWVGTADGLSCVSDGRFATVGRFEGLRDASVPSVLGGSDGSVWAGTTSGTVVRLRGDEVTHFDLPEGPGRDAVIALHEARDGSVWISADNGRLFRVKDGAVTEHTPTNLALPPGWKIPLIFDDDAGDPVFFVASVGPMKIHGRTAVRVRPDLPNLGYPHAARRGRDGTLWICASHGLARVRGEEVRLLVESDGLPHRRVRWIDEDRDGGLWVASIGGLAYVKDDTIHALTVKEGLPENYLRIVLDDGLGHLWMTSTGQIFRVSKREVLDVFAGRRPRVSVLTFDASDGLRTTETILSNSPGFRGRDGRLWFATAKGVSVVDPRKVDDARPAPEVVIEGMTVDRDAAARAAYPPGRGEVAIEYTALGFRAPGRLRFRYRLYGLDDDWVDAGTRRSAYYSNLPPGDYRFAVTASNGDGVWNGPVHERAFALRPPFYRTRPFYAGAAVAVLLLAFGSHRRRVGRMRERFAAIIGERTRIARELHDTLAQGLAGVGIQIDTAVQAIAEGPDVAREHMNLARLMVRTTLAEVRRSIWVLRAQTAKGRDGLGIELEGSLRQLTAEAGVDATIDITGRPRPLPGELERNLLRIAHEAVTNAVRHAAARTIRIGIEFHKDAVALRVADDGRGFDPAAVSGDHFGITGMSERAIGLGGALAIRSRPGAGTELSCRLPYRCRIDTTEIAEKLGASPADPGGGTPS